MIARISRPIRFLAIALTLGAVAVVPGKSVIVDNRPKTGVIDLADGPKKVTSGAKNPTGSGDTPVDVVDPPRSGLECSRSKNGGKTDTGVTAERIKLASTVVTGGAGASFLKDSPTGMQAIVRKVNRAGGICGRLLELKLVNDNWDGPTGQAAIQAFIRQGYFALPVVPSSEGLTAAIESGDIEDAGIPVIGSDGMLKQQYDTSLSTMVYPVATATVSTMRIMAKYAYGKGARCFGIVYDKQYRFGREGADAYRSQIKRMAGARICSDVGIYPQRPSYSSEIQQFNGRCDGKCDMVALLLEPQTALTWIAGHPDFGSIVTAGAQTLFNEQFAANCGEPCAGMLVWTGYNPPIGNLQGLGHVAEYVKDVRNIDPTVDITNQFLEGAYLGMKVFVEALQRVGPDLTRKRLQLVMSSSAFRTDIATTLRWTSSERHANRTAQAFSIAVAQGSFAGFKNERTGFLPDPGL